MENVTKEVYFCECKTCVHLEKAETEYPCCECLLTTHRPDSHKPIYYEGTNDGGCAATPTERCPKHEIGGNVNHG